MHDRGRPCKNVGAAIADGKPEAVTDRLREGVHRAVLADGQREAPVAGHHHRRCERLRAALQWRITDTGGRVIAEGIVTASRGAPGRGTYTVTVPYFVTTETVAFVEVYSRSPKDGNIDELVRVPVTLG